tara:strand:+ start:31703 stop:32257 length:555 start_codon:yes stop_codon:yes gene_type:complete
MDARISIAIFAALSVTAGYYALGKIEDIRNSSIIQELQSIDTALKEFQTDMGVFYKQAIANVDSLDDFKALYNADYVNLDYKRLWNGPYINEETTNHNLLGSYYLAYYRDDMSPCQSKGDCHVFIAITETPDEVWHYINDYIDGAGGSHLENEEKAYITGKVRATTPKGTRTLLYKSVSKKIRR